MSIDQDVSRYVSATTLCDISKPTTSLLGLYTTLHLPSRTQNTFPWISREICQGQRVKMTIL